MVAAAQAPFQDPRRGAPKAPTDGRNENPRESSRLSQQKTAGDKDRVSYS